MQLNMVSFYVLETKMGIYTTNYNLFMPTVGETGWGELVNGNFSTIDSIMMGLNTRLTAVENEVNGNLSCTSVTTSGKVTANGGLASTTGTFSGAVSATDFNRTTVQTVSSGTPRTSVYTNGLNDAALIFVLPNNGTNYTGSITLRNLHSSYGLYLYSRLGTNGDVTRVSIDKGTTYNIPFNNVDSVYLWAATSTSAYLTIGKVTLT